MKLLRVSLEWDLDDLPDRNIVDAYFQEYDEYFYQKTFRMLNEVI